MDTSHMTAGDRQRSRDTARAANAFDWSQTPLGPAERWSDELRTAVANAVGQRNAGAGGALPDARETETETRLQLALDAAAMGTFVWHVEEDRGDPDSRMVALLGLPPSTPLSMAFALSTLIHPDDRQPLEDALHRASRPGGDGVLRLDLRVVLPDGTHRWLSVNAKVQFEGDPPVAKRMSGAALDISARKNLEAALRENTVRVQTIISQAATGVVETDARGRMTLVNRRWCEMLGYDESELLGMNIADVTHPDSVESTREAVRRLAEGGPDFEIEKTYRRKDGSLLLATSSVSAIRAPDGDYRGLIAIVVDITSRKLAEAALRQSEERFRQFGDASSDVLWLRDATTDRSVYLSKAFETIYGIPREQLLDQDHSRWFELIAPEDREAVTTALQRVREGAKVIVEFRISRPSDGEIRWIRDTMFPVLDDAGHVLRIGGIAQDISDEKQTSGRLQVLVEELQHRTRNIVAVVRSLSNRTLQESTTLDEFRASFNERLAAVARTQGLLSRLEEGQRITFDELLETELSAHQDAQEFKSRINLEGPKGVRLRSSALQTFALAVHELTTNAIKYGALSTPTGTLTIRWRMLADDAGMRRLYVDWRERGVPMSTQGEQINGGYGRELIERALPYQMQAQTTYELGSDGVHCTIAVPISTTQRKQFAAH